MLYSNKEIKEVKMCTQLIVIGILVMVVAYAISPGAALIGAVGGGLYAIGLTKS